VNAIYHEKEIFTFPSDRYVDCKDLSFFTVGMTLSTVDHFHWYKTEIAKKSYAIYATFILTPFADLNY